MVFYSASTRGFYLPAVHGAAMPADAMAITPSRHRRLLAAQGCGREIMPGANGRPVLSPKRRPGAGEMMANAVLAVKREAARQILAIASLERQANDAAAIAGHALALAMPGASKPREPLAPALARRAAIDAVRAASNRLEQVVAGMTVAELTVFDAATADWSTP